MPARARGLVLILFLPLLFSCSSNTKKRNALILGSFAGGALVGAASAPADERRELHALYWGAIAGVAAALVGNHLHNDEDRIELLQKENQRLKAEMDLFQAGNKILIDQGAGRFKNPVGEIDLQGKRAHWKVYQVDRWVKEGPNRLYHQDKMIEITPADPSR